MKALFFPVQQHGRVSLPRTRASMDMFVMTSAEFPNTIKRTSLAPSACVRVCVCIHINHIFMSECLSGTGRNHYKVEVFTHASKTTSSPTYFQVASSTLPSNKNSFHPRDVVWASGARFIHTILQSLDCTFIHCFTSQAVLIQPVNPDVFLPRNWMPQ